MPDFLFPDCPVKKLPAVHELLREMYNDIIEVHDQAHKARLFIYLLDHLVTTNDDYLPVTLKEPDWFFTAAIDAVKAIQEPDEQAEVMKRLAFSLADHVETEDTKIEVDRILKSFHREDVMATIRTKEFEHQYITNQDILSPECSATAPSNKFQEQVNEQITLIEEAKSGHWQLALEKARLIDDDVIRVNTLLRIADISFLKVPFHEDNRLSILTECEKTLHPLLPQMWDDYLFSQQVDRLILSYAELGMVEDALEFMRGIQFYLNYQSTLKALFTSATQKHGRDFVSHHLQKMEQTIDKDKMTAEPCQILLTLAEIASENGLTELAGNYLKNIVLFAYNDNNPPVERCQTLDDLAYLAARTGNTSVILTFLHQAHQLSKQIQDEQVRHKIIVDVAETMAECGYVQESFEIFHQYQDNHSFVVLFYSEIMFKIMEYYEFRLPDEDNETWGFRQRESWLKYILHHLRQIPDITHRIYRLRYYLTDLIGYLNSASE